MIVVNKKQVNLIDGVLVGEASLMGIPVGQVPDLISVVDDSGEGFMFMSPVADVRDEEVQGWNYSGVHNSSLRLLVIND